MSLIIKVLKLFIMASEVPNTRLDRIKARGPSGWEKTLSLVEGTPNTPDELRYKEEVGKEALELRKRFLAGLDTGV